MSTPNTQVLVSKCHSSLKGTRDAWRNGPIPGLGVGKIKVILEQLAPESEDGL